MKFAYGCTRWVFLTKRYAIKVARFRIIRPFIRLVSLVKKHEATETLELYDASLIKAVLKYVGAGILANRNERRLYKKYGGEFLAPTLFTFLWLINIQVRGEPSKEEDVRRHRLWHVLKGNVAFPKGILHPRQFCVIKESPLLADYGDETLEPILDICRN